MWILEVGDIIFVGVIDKIQVEFLLWFPCIMVGTVFFFRPLYDHTQSYYITENSTTLSIATTNLRVMNYRCLVHHNFNILLIFFLVPSLSVGESVALYSRSSYPCTYLTWGACPIFIFLYTKSCRVYTKKKYNVVSAQKSPKRSMYQEVTF